MALAVKLKQLRLRSSQSLQQVADAVGASKAHVWQLEQGKSEKPSIDLVRRLADHFKVSIGLLVGEIPDSELDDEQLMVLYRDLKELSTTDRDLIQGIIDQMRKRTGGRKDET